MGVITYRRHTPEDRHQAFRLFRGSIFDYARQIGLVEPTGSDDVDAAWQRQGPMAIHLEQTAAQDWVADDDGDIVGCARSV